MAEYIIAYIPLVMGVLFFVSLVVAALAAGWLLIKCISLLILDDMDKTLNWISKKDDGKNEN